MSIKDLLELMWLLLHIYTYRYTVFFIESNLTIYTCSIELPCLEGIAWKKVWRGNSPPRVIIYSRRNVVKSVISDYRGRQMKALCGESNLSRGAQALQCQHKMPSRLNVSVSDFMRSVYHWQVQ